MSEPRWWQPPTDSSLWATISCCDLATTSTHCKLLVVCIIVTLALTPGHFLWPLSSTSTAFSQTYSSELHSLTPPKDASMRHCVSVSRWKITVILTPPVLSIYTSNVSHIVVIFLPIALFCFGILFIFSFLTIFKFYIGA